MVVVMSHEKSFPTRYISLDILRECDTLFPMNNPNQPVRTMPKFPSLFYVYRKLSDIPHPYADSMLMVWNGDEYNLPVSLPTWRANQHDLTEIRANSGRGRIHRTKFGFIRSVGEADLPNFGELVYPIDEMLYFDDDEIVRQDGTALPYPRGLWEHDMVYLCEVYEQISCEYGNESRMAGVSFVPLSWLHPRLQAYQHGNDKNLENEFYFGFVDNWHGGVDEAIDNFHKAQS